MPQIAQQDYLKIVGRTFSDAGLAKAIQAGTIFDVVVEHLNEDGEIEQARVLTFTKAEYEAYVSIYDYYNGAIFAIVINRSADNYLALAAVQAGGYGYDGFPLMTTFEASSGEFVLGEDNTGGYVTCNGKCIVATVISGRFAALATSDITPPDGEATYEVSEDDLRYFIGMTEA